jgi:hypothetical protein
MSKKRRRKPPSGGVDKGQKENLLEAIGEELQTHIEEDRKEKERD